LKQDIIILKTPREIEIMREANRIVAQVLDRLEEVVAPGVTTGEMNRIAEEMIDKAGGKAAFKGYTMNNQSPYPAAICSSVNEEIVHGIPGPRVLNEGDIVGVDVGVIFKGYVGDAARTYAVGKVSDTAARLMEVTRDSLYKGIERAIQGNRLRDISVAVQTHVETNGFSVIREFVGHGIGRQMHEPPQVPNFKSGGWNPRLEVGMVLALEPMVAQGSWKVKLLDDQWTAITADRKLSAHFEHSIAITKDGPMILSLS
jgi:methionyl aminopeptidase